jgi:hypothetical protein
MMEEQVSQEAPVTTEVAPEAAPIETPAPEAPVVAQTPTWQEELEKLDPKELRKHPRIAGIIGSELQRAKQAEQQQDQEQRRRETEDELLKFSEENAEYIRQHYPKAYEHLMGLQRQRAEQDLTNAKGQSLHAIAAEVGKAYSETVAKLTPEEWQSVSKALEGLSEEQVIPAYARLMHKFEVQKTHDEWKAKELSKAIALERDAIRQEEAAKLLKTSEGPDITKSKGTPPLVDVGSMTDEQFREHARRYNLKV